MSKVDLIAFFIVCLAQVSTSSVLTIPMSMFVYIWGTLTVPRPSRTFWILLTAYTQLLVIIKAVAHFKIFWWEDDNLFIKMFGIYRPNIFTIFELLLIVVISFQRAVLNRLGLWQSTESSAFHFEGGEFRIESCDEDTSILIGKCFNESRTVEKGKCEENISSSISMDDLIVDEEKTKETVLVKHELTEDKLSFQAVHKDRKELLKVVKQIESDNQGGFLINLQQGGTRIILRPIELPDVAKIYETSELVTVEETIEEPFEFFPSAILMSLSRHFYITRNLMEFFKPKRVAKRADVYKFFFLCDFIKLFVLLIGFKEFVVSYKY